MIGALDVEAEARHTSMASSESSGIHPRRAQMRATLTSTGKSFRRSASSSTHATLLRPRPAHRQEASEAKDSSADHSSVRVGAGDGLI